MKLVTQFNRECLFPIKQEEQSISGLRSLIALQIVRLQSNLCFRDLMSRCRPQNDFIIDIPTAVIVCDSNFQQYIKEIS
jgi:hypothetical protein